jgi:hypothetical protein
MGGPAHLARGLLGRHGPHKPYPGRAWAYKVARGPARHGPPTWSGQCRPGLNRPGQDGPGSGRVGPPVWPSIGGGSQPGLGGQGSWPGLGGRGSRPRLGGWGAPRSNRAGEHRPQRRLRNCCLLPQHEHVHAPSSSWERARPWYAPPAD